MTSPDPSDRNQSLADLTPEQRALLVLRMRQKAARRPSRAGSAPPLEPAPRPESGEMPLSFAQQRLWFMEQWQPGGAAYNIPAALHVEGRLDVAAFRWSFDEIVRRHEALRIRIDARRPVQVVRPPEPLPVPLVDLEVVPEPARAAEVSRRMQEEALRPFDLTHDRLLRVTLLRLGAAEHVVVFNMHHIISDGWSIGLLVSEFTAFYAAQIEGLPAPLPELPVQYPDYAAWQRRWLSDEVLERQLAYWRRMLDGAPAATTLPLARPRPPGQTTRSGRGSRQPYSIPPEETQRLKVLSRSEGATLFMTLLAGLDTLLHRHSGETDLVVGAPVAGRNLPEVEGLIGFFVNNLALRVDLSGDPTFRELLDRVRDVTLDAQAHQELPFEKLVEELRPERDTSRPPVFQVVLSLQNTPPMRGEMPEVAVSYLELDSATAQYDLLLSVMEGQNLGGYLEYSTDLFDPLAAARLVEHLQTLLAGAAADPDRRLSELPLLAEAERWQLLGEWNDTAETVPPACFHQVWAERAALWPDAVAVACGDQRLTYGELDRRANRLAHHLRGLGIGPEVPVGLAVERSVEMVIGVLGIWKAGGAYVPLDPAYPEERLAVMLEETALLVIVTQDRLLPRLPRFFGFTVSLDGDWDTLAAYPDEAPDSGVLPESLAYVIFTSGSTGRPKGTLLPHAGLLHLARAHERLFATGPGENLLLFAPLAFDASVFDLVMALGRGNTLHLAPQDEILPGPSLLRLLAEREISSLTITPSALAALREAPLPALRRLWVAGEACTPELVERWAPGRRFFNAYGPTEATVWVTVEEVAAAGSIPPIGRPVVNRQVHVLDERWQPVPAGGTGELYAGGAGLARGYLGRPDLTAERFVPDPFQTGGPGARLYRTGDLVRRLPDGRLEFAGRRDGQVKVRGIRIELGEVEAALAEVSCVREAAVVAHGEGEERRLAAFVVADGAAPSSSEIREALRERLPEAMVPSSFTVLPALPRTSNDKLDRRVLADLAARGTVSESVAGEVAAPRTPAEELAVRVLAEVLGVERVGLRDSFFDLGGHSLLATQILSRVREAFGVEVSLSDFFAVPTAEGLAACCEVALRSGDGAVPEAPPLRPAPRDGSLPLSFAQQRLWFLNQLHPESAAYNIPGGLRLAGDLNVPALAGSLGEVIRRHEVLRTAFPAADGRPVPAVEPWRPLALPVVDLAALPEPEREAEAGRLGAEAALRPFDLARGPLARLLLLRLDASEHALLFTMHHIVADGWSMGVLVRELTRLYPALLAGDPSPLPELPVQYADFAAWQRGWLDGEALESRLAYWRRRLAGAPSTLDLPADRPRPATSTSRGGWAPLHVEAKVAEGLQALSRRQGATLFMTLLAAFQVLLARLAGQDDVCVGTPIAGRNRMETEGLIGFFVNTLVLRGELREEDLTFESSLGRARQTALEAYAHQDVPFERLVEELRPERALSHSPLFQVMFALQNAPAEALELPGLTLGSIGVERGTTIFDLTLDVAEAPDGLRGGVEHSADLFDTVTVERWIAGFNTLLAGICADPAAMVWDLPLLAEPERRQVLEWGTGPAEESPAETTLHALFQAQVERTPEAVALIDGELRLTYQELAARASRLADWLRSAGVVPEERVGLCARRSAGMVAGLLAVLEAGGAYVPLDPGHPRPRLGRILADARPVAVLLEEGLEEVLPRHDLPVIGLASEGKGSTTGRPGVDPDNLAYLIYTSGSTGDPKGVAIRHRSAAAMVRWAWDVFPDDDLAGVLFSTSIGFDLSVFELFVPLSRGGTVVLADDALALPSLPAAGGVTLLNTVPSAMAGLLRLGGLPPSLRTVNLAGEPLTRELAGRIHELPHVERLFNLYGPSEDTTYSTFARIGGGEETPSIGRPVSGTRARVLDRRLRPVPAGAPGELCLGGVGLARGYFGRPDLTAERWVPDAFADRPGERLYRTGDLVRWTTDGDLQFLGRLDHQVKVRGYRIELGEIEAVLAAVPGVREAAVVTRGEGGSRTLVACVAASAELSPALFRDALRERLPEPMVPSAFLRLDALPLTSTGKVDRRALSRLAAETEAERADSPATGVRTPAEEMLAAIWGEVLGRDRVGLEESFFDLGGHSLLATQVVSRIRTTFGVELPLRQLFETPTVVGLARRVESALRAAAGSQAPPIRPVPPEARAEGLPLSFAQERLWFIDRLQPGTAIYNMVTAAHLRGDLDAGALARSLDTIVARHEALRTRFPRVEGDPVQVIDPPPAWSLPMIDLSGLPADRLDRETRVLVDAESVRPFDLAAGPLLCALLLRRAPRDHVAFLGTHHIVSDGWSMGVLVRELTTLYTAFAAGAPPLLPVLPVQYADFAQWQRQWLRGEVLEGQIDFWRRRMAGTPAVMALPLDRPRPAVQSFRGASEGLFLDAGLTAALQALSRRAGTTLFMTLLAGFDALLHRWTGEPDLVVGTPSANRNREEIEGLIGFFVNSLVLRADLSGAPSFSALLGQVRETTLAAYAHQDLPFEKLVAELRTERDLAHSPLFQVMIQLENVPASTLELPGLTLEFPGLDTRTAKFDLELSFVERPDGLASGWRYGADLFDAPTVLRLTRQFEVLLRGAVADPDRPVASLPCLTEAELHQVRVEWNDSAEAETDLCFPDLFAAQAGRTPDAIALSCDGWSLTYGELDRRTDHAAALLAGLGVGPESVVALLAERGPELPAVILAIQKAGGAWLPLDPSHPESRLAQVIEKSGACCVIGKDIRIEDLLSAPARPRPEVRLRPENLAYLIYTSGSTGIPKGVMVENRGMLNHLRAKVADLRLTPGDVVAQTASHTFDISVWQSFAALLAGGRVQVFRDETAHDPGRLLDGVEREQVTVLQVVPSWLGALCEVLETEAGPALAALRWLFSTGEALSVELCRRWLAVRPGIPVVNGYGPTEGSDNVSHALDVRPNAALVPIGRPLANLRLHVTGPLSGGLLPAPAGVAGELCVGGVGVGRGYQGAPARTAEAFVPDPFAAGARLYRTGDLARFLPDGTLEYLGRRDRQVKVRGFRIETGEIEAALLTHPALRQAVVVARRGALVAYVVPRSEDEAFDLRAFLKGRLPEYMVPATFVTLPALPLNANGKVDLRALPDPERAPESAEAVAPRTPLEALIAEVWSEVLGAGRFGVRDNFFELGGDSIKGAILMHRLQRRLGEALPVMALFDAPTVERLAAYLEVRRPAEAAELARRLVPIVPQDGRAPLSFAQERLWFLQQLDPAGTAYNMPNALRLRGQLDAAALERAVREVVRRHETLRTRFALHDGFPVPIVEPVPALLLPVADLSALPESARSGEAGCLLTAEALRPFDLERGPVARHLLLRLAPEEHAVLFAAHHIACDGWSLGLWAHEVQTFYQGSRLPELPVQYADFAGWQRSWLVGEELAAQVEFWRERLDGAPPFLDLPADHPRPPVQTFRGDAAWTALPGDLVAKLKGLALRHNASLFMVLLSGFQLLLGRLAGQDDLVVGSPIAGRVPEVEGLIGCFLNTLALRGDLSGDPSFAALLGRVRETALAAYAHQDVPFEKLLQELRPERDLSRTSVFQVLFNMLNAPGADVRLPGLELEPLGLSETAAKFDLTLYVAEAADGLVLNLVYNADLFEWPRMEEMLRQYRGLLDQAVADPGAAISRYTLLTPEAAAVLPDPTMELAVRWPGAAHELVAERARLRPDHPALVDPDGTWTYAELDLAARHLAARLLAEGIEPGDRVAIYAHRSAALAWAVLGVLRAGAVFVLLDPAVPAPRLIEVLRLAGPRGWLRLEAAGPLPKTLEQATFVCQLDLPATPLLEGSLPDSWPVVGPDDAACLAFTSGSTGEPKGILQTHGGMTGFLPWHEETLGYGPSDRHTMLSGLAHDPLQRDLFYCLGSGGTLCIPDPGRIGEPGWLAGWMRRERVTVTNLTPAMAQLLAEPAGTADLPELRCAVLGGDVLTRRDTARLRRLAPNAKLVNVYGSTESHRALSFHFVEEEDRGRQVVPLGVGQPGSQLLVLTRGGLLAGVGELGEISIRSPRLAAGYWQDEALTRERFVADRYRTGDLGRYLPNGEVEAAGRADQQVKVRGYRVEPGEVEAELCRLPCVREAAVAGRDDGHGGRRLVAWVVLDPAVGSGGLRDQLRERLPAYMVPSVFMEMEKLPLNPSGKVDRRALPEPETFAGAERVPPRDTLELRLARIWEEVLGLPSIGVTESFFDLGGHSLLAVGLTARIAQDFGRTLPLAALFQAPTVAELAALLREGAVEDAALVPLQVGGSRPPLFLVHPVGGQVFSYVELARLLGPDQPVYALQDVAPAEAPRSLASLASHYLREVRAVQPAGPYLLAGWSFGGRVAWEMSRQLDAAGEEVAFLGMIDTGLVSPPVRPEGDDAALLAEVIGDLPLTVEELRREADPLAALIERARQAGTLPAGTTLETAHRLLGVLKAHLEVARTDRPRPYRGKLTFFAAAEQPAEIAADPSHGWGELAGELELVRVPGDHVTLITGPENARVLARRLEEAIEAALGVRV